MQVGIVGFAGSGKTTVFNALTGLDAETGFGNKDKPNLGMIKVPDERVEFLTSVYSPKKETLAEIAFVDVAGPAGASEGGLDQRVVNHMRNVDALVNVVRNFDNPALQRAPNADRDLVDFDGELVLTDLIQIDNRLERLKKEGNKPTPERALMDKLHAHLDAGMPLRTLELSDTERQMMSGYQFLSLKPCIVLINTPEDDAAAGVPDSLSAMAGERGIEALSMSAPVEAEIAQLSADDQGVFLADLGLERSARNRFIKAAYGRLNLISFLTYGPDECRAWTIERGTNAKRAAGKIHSDIERGFIRAEVMAFEDFVAHPSEAKCREAGKLRLEGKDYVVQDGDMITFRFNV